ncbi:MAG: alpha/beta fold hydrolase, partial [Deltaproteobacteria bacterium]|nr:alpha/beta fold hydrolase [Deltaproteobacteria bacterium]
MPTVRLKDIEVYYEEHGRGEPVLLVPPSWWPCDAWKVVVLPVLSQRYRTIIFDPRGTGRSERPHHGYTLEQFAQDSCALLEHLKISRCHIVGFALGGQTAQAIAVLHPEIVATLTMAGAGPGEKSGRGGFRGINKDAEEEIREIGFERFIRSHADNDTMAFSSGFYREHREVVLALAKALWEHQGSPEHYHYHQEARRTWDTLANASRVRVPTLVLVGSEDTVARGDSTPLATARRLAELIPGAELALVPGVKHMTFWDGTQALSILMDFLGR